MSIGTPEPAWNLVADIGGTHTRFALSNAPRTLENIRVLATADYPGIEQAISHYLKSCQGRKIRRAIIGIANPILGDWIQMTNSPWAFSIEKTRTALGLDNLYVINDFTALALSLPYLPAAELKEIGGRAGVAGAPLGLLGPGTGLGVSALIPTPGGGWVPLAGEGGHASFAPADEREAGLWRAACSRFGHVSIERLLSGAGLEFIYQTLCRMDGASANDWSAAEISRHALAQSSPFCREALDTFCAILGTAAGDIALTLGARGGMYIGGGIIPQLGDYFPQSPFRKRFESKGRFVSYLADIPVFVIDSPYPALFGAAAYLSSRLET